MNLWLRVIYVFIASFFRPRLTPPFEASRLSFRVLPNDLDVNLHMNNGRYLTVMDLGRFDLILRSGLAAMARKKRWAPVLSAAKVRFRRELRLWRKYTLETRILCWSDTQFVMEHRVFYDDAQRGQTLAAHALMLGGLYEYANRRFVPVEELMRAMNVEGASPEPTPEVAAFLAAERALKRAG